MGWPERRWAGEEVVKAMEKVTDENKPWSLWHPRRAPDPMPLRSDPEAGKHPGAKWQHVPLECVKEKPLDPGKFVWGKYIVEAESKEEARRKIEAQFNDGRQGVSSVWEPCSESATKRGGTWRARRRSGSNRNVGR